MAVIRYINVIHIIKRGRKKIRQSILRVFLFLAALFLKEKCHLQIVKSNSEKALTDLEG